MRCGRDRAGMCDCRQGGWTRVVHNRSRRNRHGHMCGKHSSSVLSKGNGNGSITCPLVEMPSSDHLAPVTVDATPPPENLCPLGEWKQKAGEWTRLRSVVDSGAVASVIPPTAFPEYGSHPSPGSRRGQKFTSASGGTIANEGEQVLPAVTAGGAPTRIKKQLAAVSLPLCSVGEYCDAGNRVIFGRSGGVIQNVTTGCETPFTRENGVYLIDYWVPSVDAAMRSGFTRQGP